MSKGKKMVSRRLLLRAGAASLAGLAAPAIWSRVAAAKPEVGEKPNVLVCLFMRGGVDGLSMVVPHAEPAYYRARPNIAIARPGSGSGAAIDLDGRFGLHPSLEPLRALYREKSLAVVHAVGSPDPTRSHFDAQDFMETGTPGRASTRDGWLNRCLAELEPGSSAFRAVAMGGPMPRSLWGRAPALSVGSIESFGLIGPPRVRQQLGAGFKALYADRSNAVERAGRDALDAIDVVDALDSRDDSGSRAQYPRQSGALRDLARLITADVGVELAFVEIGGWDTHARQGDAKGQLANRLGLLARGLEAFHRDLGDEMRRVVVLTMSEFGRTVAQNGTGGTDHGHGTAMMLFGGAVRGGRVYGKWPGLEPEQLHERRDLRVTTDFRDLFGEVVARHLGVRDLERVFPGHTFPAAGSSSRIGVFA